jgi:hypothetical protein
VRVTVEFAANRDVPHGSRSFHPVSRVANDEGCPSCSSRNNYTLAAQIPQLDSLIVVPLAILDFLCIHPFAEGNGRMARLLTLKLVYKSNYEVGRYISIERVYEQTKEDYCETFSISEIEADCPGVSREAVRIALHEMSREGLIASTGPRDAQLGGCGRHD